MAVRIMAVAIGLRGERLAVSDVIHLFGGCDSVCVILVRACAFSLPSRFFRSGSTDSARAGATSSVTI